MDPALQVNMPKVLVGVPVLVVEDHPASARMAAALLGAAGAQVRMVATAEEALGVVATFRPRALIVDVHLPGVGGIELVSTLKADVGTRDIVCIAVTVVNGQELEQAAMTAGCAAYVRKPVDTDTFATLVARYLEGKK